MNLTGARTPEERVRVLVEGVLPARALPAPGPLIDVGSGNGSPGLVLALLRDDLSVTLLEPRQKRWAFLREAARRAGGPVEVLRARHDGYSGPPAATVTVRGLRMGLGELRAPVRPGGCVIVFGTAPREEPPFRREAAPAGLSASVFRAEG